MGASAAAAIIIRRERDLVAHFRSAGATTPATATTPAALGVDQQLAWSRLVDRAVIRSTPNGAFYLDELSWNALRRVRRRMLIVLLVAVLAVLAGLISTALERQ